MSKPDYSQYSLEELKESLEWIDRDEWPDRVAEIKSILNDPKKRKALEHKQEFTNVKRERESQDFSSLLLGICYLFIAGLVVFTGILIGKHGEIYIESIEARIAIGFILALVGAFTIKSVLRRNAHSKVDKARRKKRAS